MTLFVVTTDDCAGQDPAIVAAMCKGEPLDEGDLLVVFDAGDERATDSRSDQRLNTAIGGMPAGDLVIGGSQVVDPNFMGWTLADAQRLAIKKGCFLCVEGGNYILTRDDRSGRVVRHTLQDIVKVLS